MQQTWLIAGPPGCGKTNWIRESLLKLQGVCAYLRLDGLSHEGLEAAMNAGIDRTWLIDQFPQLQDLSLKGFQNPPPSEDRLVLVEAQQFNPSSTNVAQGIDPRIQEQLERFNL